MTFGLDKIKQSAGKRKNPLGGEAPPVIEGTPPPAAPQGEASQGRPRPKPQPKPKQQKGKGQPKQPVQPKQPQAGGGQKPPPAPLKGVNLQSGRDNISETASQKLNQLGQTQAVKARKKPTSGLGFIA